MWWMLGAAFASYGVPVDGHPGWEDRAIHLWTNAARMAPEHWTDDYFDGGCGLAEFQAGERTPDPPLKWHDDLGRAARFHSQDMVDNRFFAHESSDGTPFDQRIVRFYSGLASGENIARGYQTSRNAVLRGWMCSPGHRANIMRDMFDEIGTSRVAGTYTQNFGADGTGPRPVNIALHDPEEPSDYVTFWSDVWVDPGTLEAAVVVLDGVETPLALEAGEAGRGLYRVRVPVPAAVDDDPELGEPCHRWWVEVRTTDGAVARYPEIGAYGFGACVFDDPAGWLADDGELEADGCGGCDGVGGGAAWTALLALGALRRRRRALPDPERACDGR
jgi:uncharacterized protein (TIGR03382 family)